MSQSVNMMQKLGQCDKEFSGLLTPVWGKVMADGALDQKTKTLMILFFDATQGQHEAVKALGARARQLGATDDQIRETIRLAFLTSGITGLSAGLSAFE